MIKAVIFDMYETLITHYASPLYFGTQMAQDAKMPAEQFRKLWASTEYDRSIGKITLEETVEMILRKNGTYTDARLNTIVQKRIAAKEECFRHLHPEIIPMLQKLKEKGVSIGLISNCFSEEAEVIRRSVLFSYFDAVCLSYEQGVQKPNAVIFQRCMEELSVNAEECIYVGDGGSCELAAARALGMYSIQAVWYYKDGVLHPLRKRADFAQMESPLRVVQYFDKLKQEIEL